MAEQKVIVITGTSSGIGEAVALLLAQAGHLVYGGPRREGTTSVPNLKNRTVDVSDDASVSSFVDGVLSETGRIDVLINNAGVSLLGPIEITQSQEVSWVFDTNVLGRLRLIRAVLPSMRTRKSGLIINVSSVLGFLPAPFMGVYAASKHALEGLSESLDHEIRNFGVRVVLLEPTFTNTNLDVNATQTAAPLGAYASQFQATISAVQGQIKSAPSAQFVAEKIADVIDGPYKLRQPVGKNATLLSRLRRFMPAKAVDGSLRKTFGFAKKI
ncbi:oxidoreductase [Brucella thiophenivorans]|uniref:KR domain protein n=1 Tax=Brucella thiophenivorans TaxID=571255 RepID=A0A256FB65_9HYPH|nr:oxidoreductase [Brucella thiophenivorans]OYR11691.1 KR domain protein [Brucella thiophenivorans]